MAWVARDKTGQNSYRLFGMKPIRAFMVSYDGEIMPDQWTWTVALEMMNRPEKGSKPATYKPLGNYESTELEEGQSPAWLAPGDGPIEVRLELRRGTAIPPRPFEGAGI